MSRTFHHGLKAKKRRFGKNWRWLQQTPGWWVNEFMTTPQRAETRDLLRRVLKLRDPEDAPLFPLAKKPHLYYW